jgi:MFS family permease
VVGGADRATWLSSTVAIETAVLGPPISQAADYWGRKWFIVVSATFGFIGCFVIARGETMGMVIGGEILAAMSLGSQPLLYAVASEILPRRWRPEAQAGLNVALGFGAIFTLLAGLKFVDDSPDGFRTFFYIATGLNGVAAVICVALYNPPLRILQKSLKFGEKMAKVRIYHPDDFP